MQLILVGFATLLAQVVLLREIGVASYGGEIVYVLGLAVLVDATSKWRIAGQRRWSTALLWTLIAACALYGLALLIARFNYTWTNPWGLALDGFAGEGPRRLSEAELAEQSEQSGKG